MYEFTKHGGVTVTCGACHAQTPAHTTTRLRIGDPPSWMKVETGQWDFSHDCAATRILKLPRTDTVDACPACVDRLARQRRQGGNDYLPRPTAPRITNNYMKAMPRLIKTGKAATP